MRVPCAGVQANSAADKKAASDKEFLTLGEEAEKGQQASPFPHLLIQGLRATLPSGLSSLVLPKSCAAMRAIIFHLEC